MREALRQIEDAEYWVYGPTVAELERVVEVVQRYSDYADACVENLTVADYVPAEFADAHAEVSSDLRYYNYLEKGLLWSFALWRLQGIFEAMLVSRFLPTRPAKPLVGLRSKLDAVVAAGYRLTPESERELIAWGRLRNTLSHMPPEQYGPIAIDKEDVEDCLTLLKQICSDWEAQRTHARLFALSRAHEYTHRFEMAIPRAFKRLKERQEDRETRRRETRIGAKGDPRAWRC